MVTAALLTLEINKLTETKNAETARAHQVKTGPEGRIQMPILWLPGQGKTLVFWQASQRESKEA